MKTLFSKKASIIFFLFISNLAQGAVVVKQLKGNAFMIFGNKTQSLNVGDHAPKGAEILTEEGTEMTLSNYYNHQFHITGSSHLKVDKKSTQLLEGYLWFRATSQSRGGSLDFDIRTSNGIVQYNDTEGIISFDPYSGKTQFLNFRGTNAFFNKVRPGPQYEVKSGTFSFIDSKYNKGIPRKPAPIGLKPYKKLMSLYEGIRTLPPIPKLLNEIQTPRRGIASINGQKYDDLKDILKKYSLSQNNRRREPAPIKVNIYSPASRKMNQQQDDEATIKLPIEISKKSTSSTKENRRSPASIAPNPHNPFEQALQSRYKDKMRKNKEIKSLIDALKSINQDYQRNH